jgi:hypothetical protein
LQPTDLLKRHAEKPHNLFHTQSIRRRLNSYNFDAGLDYEKTTGSKHLEASSIVCTIAAEIVRTIIHNSASPKDGSIVEQKNRELSEQKNTIPNILDSRN